jgi:putative MFS transporter
MMTLALAVLGLIPEMGAGWWCWRLRYTRFSRGPGNLQWLYPNELFPTDIRASAVGVIMSLSRIGTIVSTWALPIFITKYGISYVMLMGGNFARWPAHLHRFCPETRGLTLAQTREMTIRRKP